MYVRVAEVTAQSELQFKMLMAFVEKKLLPRNIAAGQLSGKYSELLQIPALSYHDSPQSQKLTRLCQL
tara:strand:+ start:242 stop:445 length:204 start_codon:yes stop_codon:yes gene_type:complete